MKIIFFHHAGGDKYAFLPYKPHLESIGWEAVYYDLPGHGDRYHEPLIHDVGLILDDIWDRISHELTGDYVLFGNSMGSLLAYLLLHRIEEANLQPPLHFFAASRMCPASYPVVIRKTDMTHEEFWEMIREYGGASDFIDNVEFRSMFEPILRADYGILESYIHLGKRVLDIPATLMFGARDRYSPEDRQTWSTHFCKPVNYQVFDSGHFFVYENPVGVLEVMRTALSAPAN
ncbi:MAG: thioesterase [Bacteroidetes bacterium]|nr:thioesterase [Bacteroidota bacterium]